jgi:hypothetical protein
MAGCEEQLEAAAVSETVAALRHGRQLEPNAWKDSPGVAAVCATPNDVAEYARTIGDLLDDPRRPRVMARLGRQRVEGTCVLDHPRVAATVGVVDLLSGRRPEGSRRGRGHRPVALELRRVRLGFHSSFGGDAEPDLVLGHAV